MGGGDLNSKKSWHPNTMKNQERVWKAEQAAAEEKKRMLELQREHAEERDRAELNAIMRSTSGAASDNRLAWMYDKPDKKVEQEAYLLGKVLDKTSGQPEQVEPDAIPAVSRRVVGSSMLTSAGDTQVDMSRKIREDPLLLIKERERAARAALLNNPLQRRRLAELLRKEQDERKETKTKKKSKKKDKDLDNLLAAKLTALGGEKGVDLATLLNSDDSSSESEHEKHKKQKKRDKKKKKKKRKHSSDNDSDNSTPKHKDGYYADQKRDKKTSEYKNDKHDSKVVRKRRSSDSHRHSVSPVATKYHKKEKSSSRQNDEYSSRSINDRREQPEKHGPYRKSPARESERQTRNLQRRDNKRGGGLSQEEKAARLAEMAAAGAEREIERGKRVAEQRVAESAADSRAIGPRSGARGLVGALPDSLQDRIHSTRHYIQRDKRHMNENFARR